MNSYLTLDETLLFYPNASEYASEQQAIALETSYSLVNSFLDSTLTLPAIDEGGNIPGILKLMQSRFYQYILESSNHGYSDELKKLFDATAETLNKITQNELIVSEVQITAKEIGWNISENNLTAGQVFVSGDAPLEVNNFVFTVISTGTTFVADAIFEVKRSDSDIVFSTINGDFDWQVVGISYLNIRFDGQFTSGETFSVRGTPNTKEVVSPRPVFQQVEVYYG
jgi:hypothetical protein